MPHVYGLDESAQIIASRAAALAADVVAARAADVDAHARFPEESIAALAGEGLLGLCVASALGGKGQGPRAFAAVTEELAQACASTAMVYVMHVSAAQAIAASTTLAGRDDLLRDIAGGRHLSTLALSERGSRSQFWAPVSHLEERDGGYVTSAEKSWVTAAGRADSYVSSAQKPARRRAARVDALSGAPRRRRRTRHRGFRRSRVARQRLGTGRDREPRRRRGRPGHRPRRRRRDDPRRHPAVVRDRHRRDGARALSRRDHRHRAPPRRPGLRAHRDEVARSSESAQPAGAHERTHRSVARAPRLHARVLRAALRHDRPLPCCKRGLPLSKRPSTSPISA